MRRLLADRTPVTGEREIDPAIVVRIFAEYVSGQPPRKIAARLNAEGIPGPRGSSWSGSTMNGSCQRCNGILNKELYLGHLVWNRQRFIKDPRTGRRVACPNPAEGWVVEDVPDLRIIEDALLDGVKARQGEIDASPKVRALKENRFWEHRRPMHLLTGLVQCACCRGNYIGRQRLSGVRQRPQTGPVLPAQGDPPLGAGGPDLVLDLVGQGMMQPGIVKAFVSAYTQEINEERASAEVERARQQREFASLTAKLDGLYDAIAEGFRSPGLLGRLEGIEAEKRALEQTLAGPPSPVRLHPNLAELYREKVVQLRESLAEPSIRDEALGLLHGLIMRVLMSKDENGGTVDIQSQTEALLALGSRTNNAPGETRLDPGALSSDNTGCGGIIKRRTYLRRLALGHLVSPTKERRLRRSAL